jgi:thioredoxin-related protein
MKKIFFIFVLCFSIAAFSQEMAKFNMYKPAEDAEVEIANAIQQAKNEGKHVFIQIGGNWCVWCARFIDFVGTDKQIDSLVNANYIVYHMNYSKENKNEKLLTRYGYPQRFGFPVFLILDGDGKLLHIQNSAYLEEGKSYNRNTVVGFFKDWSPKALEPSQYIEQ